jgi:diketogulonate reductase-like aldo/keto reductase
MSNAPSALVRRALTVTRRPRTVVIPKTARPERLEHNLNVGDFELDANDAERIDALGTRHQRFFDPPWHRYAWDER